MRCSKIERMLTPLLDGRLEAAEQTLVEQHLQGCAGCRATHALLLATHQTLAAAGPAAVPDGLAERAARAAFTTEPAETTDWFAQLVQTLRWPALGTATAGMLLAVGLLTSVPQHMQDAGVTTESMAAMFATEDDVVADDELLSEVLGQEEE